MEDLSNTIPGKFIFFTKRICISKEKVGFTPKEGYGAILKENCLEVFFNTRGLLIEPLHDYFHAPQKFW